MSIPFKSLTDLKKKELDKYTPSPRRIDLWYGAATMTYGHPYHITELSSPDAPFWPQELMPYFKESDWEKLSVPEAMLAQKKAAIGYLGTTDSLEPKVIIPICQVLASGEPFELEGFHIPEGLRTALLQVKTDEALHETISHTQLVELGIEDAPEPHFTLGLGAAMATARKKGLDDFCIKLLMGCCTELSVTKFLGYATSPDVQYNPSLKKAIVAHEQDERYHAGIFGCLFKVFFEQLDEPWRELYASYIPALLKAFRQRQPSKSDRSSGGRSVKELLSVAEALAVERRREAAARAAKEQRRREREQEVAKAKRLEKLSKKQAAAWRQVETLIGTKQPKSYDEAVSLLRDLHDLSVKKGKQQNFESRIEDVGSSKRPAP